MYVHIDDHFLENFYKYTSTGTCKLFFRGPFISPKISCIPGIVKITSSFSIPPFIPGHQVYNTGIPGGILVQYYNIPQPIG